MVERTTVLEERGPFQSCFFLYICDLTRFMKTPYEQLRTCLANFDVIPVVGAGVSRATAGVPAWEGLIDAGLGYIESVSDGDYRERIALARQLLNEKDFLGAADLLQEMLGAPERVYQDWLKDFFAQYKQILDSRLVLEIQSLLAPMIATTNYDTLLSTIGFEYNDRYHWMQDEEIQIAINEKASFILHLHGVYSHARSVILGTGDYKRLNEDIAYKSTMQTLFATRHLLFIGCSRDGVLDPDFLQTIRFFKDNHLMAGRLHFLLLKTGEKIDRLSFLKTYGIQIIYFGDRYEELPDFINALNPNKRLIPGRIEAVDRQYQAIIELAAKEDPLKLGKAVVSILPGEDSYVQSEAIAKLRKTVEENTQLNLTKRQQFSLYQTALLWQIDVDLLAEKIEQWNQNAWNTDALCNGDFINMGVIAFQALSEFPAWMLQDVRRLDYRIIHDYYFRGYLNEFAAEAIAVDRKLGVEAYKNLLGDRYFFENLKRIMVSLRSLLQLSPWKLYPDAQPALLTPVVPDVPLILISTRSISLYDAETMRQCAKLFAQGIDFEAGELVPASGDMLVVFHTSAGVFFWNPVKDLSPTEFFACGIDGSVEQVVSRVISGQIRTMILTDKELVHMVDFLPVSSINRKPIKKISFTQDGQRLIALGHSRDGIDGAAVLEVLADGSLKPLLEKSALYELLTGIPGIKTMIKRAMVEEACNKVSEMPYFPFIADLRMKLCLRGDEQMMLLSFCVKLNVLQENLEMMVLCFSLRTEQPDLRAFHQFKNQHLTDLGYLFNGNFYASFLDHLTVSDLIAEYLEQDMGPYRSGLKVRGWLPSQLLAQDVRQLVFTKSGDILVNRNRNHLLKLDSQGNVLHEISFDLAKEILVGLSLIP